MPAKIAFIFFSITGAIFLFLLLQSITDYSRENAVLETRNAILQEDLKDCRESYDKLKAERWER